MSRKLLDGFLVLLAIVGFVLSVLTFFPRLTVNNLPAIDPDKPFSTPFIVSNDGYLPLYNVKFMVAVNSLVTHTYHFDGIGFGLFLDAGDSAAIFYPTEKYSLYLGRYIQAYPRGIREADIAIQIEYRPMFYWGRRWKMYRFVAQPGPDGRLYWNARPLSN